MAKNKKNSKKQAGNKTWIWVLLGLVAVVAAILIINYSGSANPNQLPATVTVQDASTRFTDGAEFGMGAEIGISTEKLHARGPMGLEELTTYKYVIHGNGQIRG